MKAPHKLFEPFWCSETHMEGDDLVCDLHGFMWESHRQYCNAISKEQEAFLKAALGWYQFKEAILTDVEGYLRFHAGE